MKGWTIFVHSVQLVLRNLGDALRVSAVLYLVQVAGQIILFLDPPQTGSEGLPMVTPEQAGLQILLGIAGLVASLWIAVGWHRFVLEEEYPSGFVPRWHGTAMLSYLGRSILIGILVVFGVLIAMIPVALVSAVVPGLAGIMVPGLIGLGAYIVFRLGVMLPAAALGRSMKVGEAWAATKDRDGAIVVLALLVIAGSVLLQAPSMISGNPASPVSLVYGIVTGWFATMISISILTTLYGHYIEGRPVE